MCDDRIKPANHNMIEVENKFQCYSCTHHMSKDYKPLCVGDSSYKLF